MRTVEVTPNVFSVFFILFLIYIYKLIIIIFNVVFVIFLLHALCFLILYFCVQLYTHNFQRTNKNLPFNKPCCFWYLSLKKNYGVKHGRQWPSCLSRVFVGQQNFWLREIYVDFELTPSVQFLFFILDTTIVVPKTKSNTTTTVRSNDEWKPNDENR